MYYLTNYQYINNTTQFKIIMTTKILKIIQFSTEVVFLVLGGLELRDAIIKLREEKHQNQKTPCQ